ncbi:MAG: cysteine--tRNA ligase [Candidatus Pacebacteria bacterium]|nr:cysteine--tRNA ligase [Candidatus Paceibacterota bacterium]MBP9701109.1 cysteine--tRNA ligase [Candidatus Paceibacterota bacterium]
MSLHLYNTASRSIEEFVPLNAPIVTMYACGPTVYDYTHIGHLRKYIGDDILRRTLTLLGYKVKHVMNITDVGHLTNDSDEGDDKFEKKASVEGKSVWDIAELYTDYFHTSMQAVNVLAPTIEPRATTHVPQMVALVEQLIAKGFAYETSQAIYFDVAKDPAYGELSGQKLEQKEIGARDDVVTDPDKHHPADFALWFKRVGKFADHAMYWASPWGDGFPGWHIECSAMSMHYLGETIDIHTGGIDHIPVHHENEIAQSECATGHPFVRYWVHHDFLTVDGVKMSKSLNNFYKLDDILARKINPLAVRLMFMQTSYRKPLNFTWETLETADIALKKLQKFVAKQPFVGDVVGTYRDAFIEALSDDVNTAKALAVVWELLNDSAIENKDKWATLLVFDTVLGLDLARVAKIVITPEVLAIAQKRDEARANKDYALSDKIRAQLETFGYDVLDTPEGTVLQ